jgi:hypothetical protein
MASAISRRNRRPTERVLPVAETVADSPHPKKNQSDNDDVRRSAASEKPHERNSQFVISIPVRFSFHRDDSAPINFQDLQVGAAKLVDYCPCGTAVRLKISNGHL